MKKTKDKIKSKLTKKFRLVVLNEASFEERFSFKLTRLNVFVFGGIISVLLIGVTVFIIAFTPIKEYIPGYSSTKLKRQATSLFYKVDSLQAEVNVLSKFTEAIRPILIGEDTIVTISLPYRNTKVDESLALKFPVKNDSIASLIEKVRLEMDSTYQEHYKNETSLLQKKHQEAEVSLQGLHKKSFDDLEEKFVSTQEKQGDSIQDLRITLLSKDKQISGLKKQIALTEIEAKHTNQSLSKGNKQAIIDQQKNAEKVRKEVQTLLQKEFITKEKIVSTNHEQEVRGLNAMLFSKEAVIDSLTFQLVSQQQKKIGELANEKPFKEVDTLAIQLLARSSRDSIFREAVEREDRYSLFDFETSTIDDVFFAPVKGIITEGYNVKDKHFAVDIAVTKGTAVKSIADGTIIFAEWTAQTGYVIIIEHANKYLSVYKHNETLYRDQGDLVKSGEVISIAGSSGEYSTGPHLHFEMWNQGYSVNPINFIEFE
jgi:murein DD-endopeptidase MepM/ murein hydrolase activator NlpD